MKQLFSEFMDTYYKWHIDHIGFPPKIDGGDGKGLKQMIGYLKSLSGSERAAVDSFRYILHNWDSLPDFYKKQTRLRQINGNIHNIVFHFKTNDSISKEYISDIAKILQGGV